MRVNTLGTALIRELHLNSYNAARGLSILLKFCTYVRYVSRRPHTDWNTAIVKSRRCDDGW